MKFAAICLFAAAGLGANAADWTEWRGPHRDGVLVNEPKAWPEKLNLKWKIEVGEGHASPILVGSTIYEFTRLNDQETVQAIDLRGWQSSLEAAICRDLQGESRSGWARAGAEIHAALCGRQTVHVRTGRNSLVLGCGNGQARVAQRRLSVQDGQSGIRHRDVADCRSRHVDRTCRWRSRGRAYGIRRSDGSREMDVDRGRTSLLVADRRGTRRRSPGGDAEPAQYHRSRGGYRQIVVEDSIQDRVRTEHASRRFCIRTR